MNVLIHWIPTFAAVAILVVAAFILDASIRRDERRIRKDREGPFPNPESRPSSP